MSFLPKNYVSTKLKTRQVGHVCSLYKSNQWSIQLAQRSLWLQGPKAKSLIGLQQTVQFIENTMKSSWKSQEFSGKVLDYELFSFISSHLFFHNNYYFLKITDRWFSDLPKYQTNHLCRNKQSNNRYNCRLLNNSTRHKVCCISPCILIHSFPCTLSILSKTDFISGIPSINSP